jgi:hypothetical protein
MQRNKTHSLKKLGYRVIDTCSQFYALLGEPVEQQVIHYHLSSMSSSYTPHRFSRSYIELRQTLFFGIGPVLFQHFLNAIDLACLASINQAFYRKYFSVARKAATQKRYLKNYSTCIYVKCDCSIENCKFELCSHPLHLFRRRSQLDLVVRQHFKTITGIRRLFQTPSLLPSRKRYVPRFNRRPPPPRAKLQNKHTQKHATHRFSRPHR